MRIRPAVPADSARLQDLQVTAGAAFHDVDMPEVADNTPTSIDAFDAYANAGRSWVIVDEDSVIAFVLVELVDDCAHIEQVSVDPAYGRRGIGATLVDHVDGWASSRGYAGLSLTTFRDVPWNAPYYARLGFAEVTDPGPGLRAMLAEEATVFDGRVAMRRALSSRTPDRLGKLYEIADAYRAKYPSGDTPFAILSRVLEEAGEIAAEVNHLEGMGAKHAKHGDVDPKKLADEIEDILHCVAGLARYYRVEDLVDASIDATHARLTSVPAEPARTIRHKAVCYIVRDGELLVFRHVGYDWERVGVQVPAGGVEPGERPEDAALREAFEETGLTGLRVVSKLGQYDYDAAPHINQIHRCHVFHLEPTGSTPSRWRSQEDHGGGEAIPFECFWIPLADAHVLQAGQGTLIGRLPGLR